MSLYTELLPFIFLGIVVGIFIPAGNNSTTRLGGVRPLSVPHMGASLRTQSFVAGFMANFLNIIGHLVAALRGATIGLTDLTTTSFRRLFVNAESAATAPVHPYNILWAKVQGIRWAGLSRMSSDVLSDVEASLDSQPFEPIYTHYYVTSFLLSILSQPNAIAPGARANITEHMVYNDATLFNEEYLFCAFGNNPIVVDLIIATSNYVSPVVIGLLHRAWSDPSVAEAFHSFSHGAPSWDRYIDHVPGTMSIQQIAHSVHCQTAVWPLNVPFEMSDGEVEFMAALFAMAIFAYHNDSFSLTK